MKKSLIFLIALFFTQFGFAQKRTGEAAGSVKYVLKPINPYASRAHGFTDFILLSEIHPLNGRDEKMSKSKFASKETNAENIRIAAEDSLEVFGDKYLNIGDYFKPVGDEEGLSVILNVGNLTVTEVAENFKELKQRDIAIKVDLKALLEVKSGGQVIFSKNVVPSQIKGMRKDILLEAPILKSRLSKLEKAEDRNFMVQDYLLNDMNKRLLKAILESAKEELTKNFGTREAAYYTDIYSAKGKKGVYDELDKIQLELSEVMKKTGSLSKKKRTEFSQVIELMKPALPVWEKYLQEENYEDKKAKINAQIADGLHYNCALGYVIIGEIAKAKEHILKVDKSRSDALAANGFTLQAQRLRKMIEYVEESKGNYAIGGFFTQI